MSHVFLFWGRKRRLKCPSEDRMFRTAPVASRILEERESHVAKNHESTPAIRTFLQWRVESSRASSPLVPHRLRHPRRRVSGERGGALPHREGHASTSCGRGRRQSRAHKPSQARRRGLTRAQRWGLGEAGGGTSASPAAGPRERGGGGSASPAAGARERGGGARRVRQRGLGERCGGPRRVRRTSFPPPLFLRFLRR